LLGCVSSYFDPGHLGRRIFDWRVGFIAVVIIISDPTLLERSRLLRNDYAAEAFALLAFLLYEIAEQRKSSRLYIAAGLADGVTFPNVRRTLLHLARRPMGNSYRGRRHRTPD